MWKGHMALTKPALSGKVITNVWFVHGGYKFNDRYEGVLRFYIGEYGNSGVTTDLSNT
jgi:hypothetical protein